MPERPAPTLIVVSGPPRTGKTTLAHAIARAIPCPAVCRDEIKEGMVHAHRGMFQPAPGDPLTQRTFPLFFDVLRMLLAEEVTVVAEAAFQDQRWRQGLEPLTDLALLRVVHCHTEPAVAKDRRRTDETAHTGFHGEEVEDWERAFASFDRLSLPVPSIEVDTTGALVPDIEDIIEFICMPAGRLRV